MPSLEWFAVRVKSNRERVTAQGLRGKGYEIFLPEYLHKGHNGREHAPAILFPGYIFCRFDLNNRLPILILPGVMHVVGFGKVPAPVDPQELKSLQLIIDAGLTLNPHEPYTVGEKVRIEEGPLAGASGIVVGHKSERLIVSVSLLQRSVSVILDTSWIGARQRTSISQPCGANSLISTARTNP